MKKKNYSHVQLFSWRTIVQNCSRSFLSWKPLLMLALFLGTLSAYAQSYGDYIYGPEDSKKGRDKFMVIDATRFQVAYVGSTRTGDVTIPAQVRHGDKTYAVTRVRSGGWGSVGQGITSITFSEGLTQIDWAAMSGAGFLTTINLPASVTTISEGAFAGLPALKTVNVSSSNTQYRKSGDALIEVKGGDKKLIVLPARATLNSSGEYTVPTEVNILGGHCFYYHWGLRKVNIHKDVKQLSSTSFLYTNLHTIDVNDANQVYCSQDGVLYNEAKTTLISLPRAKNIASFTVPKGCIEISTYAISHQQFMTSINLNEVKHLNNNAISNCGKLTEVTIPKGIRYIPQGSIISCVNLASFKIPEGHPTFKEYNNDGVIYSAVNDTLILYPSGKKDTKYSIRSGTKVLAVSSFAGNQSLQEVTIPTSVTHILSNVFNNMKLTKVTFAAGSTVQEIANTAFYNCSELTSIKIPASVTRIGASSFQVCRKLTTVTVENNSKLRVIGAYAFDKTALSSFTFEGTSMLQEIHERAFAELPLTSFRMPATVTMIKRGAFSGCQQLTDINFDKLNSKISLIGEGAFANCGLTNVELPNSVTRIDREAFLDCAGIKRVDFSRAVHTVHPEAFKGCSNLQEFTVAKDNTTYSAVKGMLCNAAKTELKIFPPGQAIDPKTKQSKNVVLLPPSLTKIGDYAFYSVPMLKQVTIPQRVTSIGNRAFGLCTKLTDIVFLCDQMIPAANIPTALNLAAFDEVHTGAVDQRKKITIYVRQGVLAAYQAEPYYKTGFKEIKSSFTVPYAGVAGSSCEYMPYSSTSVELLKVVAPGLKTFVASNEVVNPAEAGIKRSVQLIGDYAFQNTTLQEVIIKSPNVYSIGARAFVTSPITTGNTSTIQNIFFSSNNVPGVLKSVDFELKPEYNEFLSSQNIYVKKTMMDDFRAEAAWSKYLSRVQYKIPAPRINNYYTTFSREFDVDFEDGTANKQVHAFIANSKQLKNGSGDVGQPTQKKITFVTLTVAGKQGTYVPANTGVLIKNLGKTSPLDFYYRIGENDSETHTVGTNYLKPVTEKDKVLAANTSNYYVLQQGIFRFVNRAKTPTATVPVHKAYLDLGTGGAASDLSLYFEGDDDLTTGLEAVEVETTTRAPYYRLDGTRVVAPGRGLYIHNGKKVFLNK